MELANILANAGGAVALAYIVLMWKREDEAEARHKLTELIERVDKTQVLTADALTRLTDTLRDLHDRITRLEVIKEMTQPKEIKDHG
jgi:hypothetical protein